MVHLTDYMIGWHLWFLYYLFVCFGIKILIYIYIYILILRQRLITLFFKDQMYVPCGGMVA